MKITAEQIIYQLVGRKFIVEMLIQRLFYRFLLQKVLFYTVVIRTPSWFVQGILLLISVSSTITIVGEETLRKIKEENQKVIFAFWHGDYTLLLASLRTKKAVALVDSCFRGNYVAQLFASFNYRVVRTSKSSRSILELLKAIKQGYSGFIAVDGPHGPSHKTRPGTIYIAQKAKALIVPLTITAHRGLIFGKRWDHHVFPLPFSKITVSIGAPIEIGPDDSLEIKALQVTRSLQSTDRDEKRTILAQIGPNIAQSLGILLVGDRLIILSKNTIKLVQFCPSALMKIVRALFHSVIAEEK